MPRTSKTQMDGDGMRTEVIRLRTTKEFKDLVKARADYLGVSVSDYIARLVNADLDAPMKITK